MNNIIEPMTKKYCVYILEKLAWKWDYLVGNYFAMKNIFNLMENYL